MFAATISVASEKQAFEINQYEIRLKIDVLSKKGISLSVELYFKGSKNPASTSSFLPMKKLFNFCVVAWFGINVMGQTQQTTSVPTPTPYAIVSRDANSRVWEQTTYEVSPSGQTISHVNNYTELGTGLCYQQNGQWMDSREQINILPDGSASGTNGQHQAYFPSDIYNGTIKLVTPDGLQLQSQPVGLFYDDGSNTVMIAELTNSVGQLISPNQMIYTNAFTGVDADLLYTYRMSGFEQDVIFRQQPPAPEQFGLNSDSVQLQLLTEYYNPPTPGESVGPLPLRFFGLCRWRL